MAAVRNTVEDAFGFFIPDEDAAGWDTLGKLHEYVLAHRFCGRRESCLNSIAFYKLRRAMTAVLPITRDAAQPATELTALIPSRRRRTWRLLRKATGFRLPELRRPGWVTTTAAVAAIASGIALPRLLGINLFHGAIVLAIATAMVAGYSLFWLTEPLAFEFRPELATAGQLAKAMLARNYQAIVAESCHPADAAEVWIRLCSVVAGPLGTQPERLTKATKIA